MEQKTEYRGIYKKEEGVFVNKDKEGLAAYKKMKKQLEDNKNIREEINSIRNDLEEIKALLKGLAK
jgi:hypothetical protein